MSENSNGRVGDTPRLRIQSRIGWKSPVTHGGLPLLLHFVLEASLLGCWAGVKLTSCLDGFLPLLSLNVRMNRSSCSLDPVVLAIESQS